MSHLPNTAKMALYGCMHIFYHIDIKLNKTFLFPFLFFISFFASVIKNFLNKNKPKILLLGSFYSDLFIFPF